MCSIYGAYGLIDRDAEIETNVQVIRENARDRGRDGGQIGRYLFPNGFVAYLGNWRARPTTELKDAPLQPYDGVVHNGTIANDKELGGQPGEVDSQVLARVIDRQSVFALRTSLEKVVGSYALAAVGADTVLLAANYKPLFYYSDGETTYFSSMERHLKDLLAWGQRPVQVGPYEAVDLGKGHNCNLKRMNADSAVVVCSGGLDSTVVATFLKHQGYRVHLLHFIYGARAGERERRLIPLIAESIGATFSFERIDYTTMKGNSPLLDPTATISGGIKGAEYAHEWVPARNLLMMAHAAAYAEANDYHTIALGNNLEEAGSYPDNEEQFTLEMNHVMNYAVQNSYRLRVVSPVGHLMKHEIVKMGLDLNAPLRHTWSCYHGEEKHCGNCGPCFMRKAAFTHNGLVDPVFK